MRVEPAWWVGLLNDTRCMHKQNGFVTGPVPTIHKHPAHITHSSTDLLVLTLVAIVPVSLLVCYVVLAVVYGFVR